MRVFFSTCLACALLMLHLELSRGFGLGATTGLGPGTRKMASPCPARSTGGSAARRRGILPPSSSLDGEARPRPGRGIMDAVFPSPRQRAPALSAAADLSGFSFGSAEESSRQGKSFIMLVGIKEDEADVIAEIIKGMDGYLARCDVVLCGMKDLSGTVGDALDGVLTQEDEEADSDWNHLDGVRVIMVGGVIAEEEQDDLMMALDETELRPSIIVNVPSNPAEVLGSVVEAALTDYDDMWGLADKLQVPEEGSKWDPKAAKCSLNAEIEGAMVFTRTAAGGGEGVRWDTAKVVVIDDFFGEKEREELLALVTEEGWDHSKGPPEGKWEKVLMDVPGLPDTWGLSADALAEVVESTSPAMLEIQARHLSICLSIYPSIYLCMHSKIHTNMHNYISNHKILNLKSWPVITKTHTGTADSSLSRLCGVPYAASCPWRGKNSTTVQQ